LRPLGAGKSFCDGISIAKTPLTSSIQAVRSIFAKHELHLWTVVAKDKSWFVKLDEDKMPEF